MRNQKEITAKIKELQAEGLECKHPNVNYVISQKIITLNNSLDKSKQVLADELHYITLTNVATNMPYNTQDVEMYKRDLRAKKTATRQALQWMLSLSTNL